MRKKYWRVVFVVQVAIALDFAYCLWAMPRAVYADVGHWVVLSLVLVLLMAGETWRDRRAP